MVQVNIYITIETKEAARIGYNKFLFLHLQIWPASFVSIVLYLINVIWIKCSF